MIKVFCQSHMPSKHKDSGELVLCLLQEGFVAIYKMLTIIHVILVPSRSIWRKDTSSLFAHSRTPRNWQQLDFERFLQQFCMKFAGKASRCHFFFFLFVLFPLFIFFFQHFAVVCCSTLFLKHQVVQVRK